MPTEHIHRGLPSFMQAQLYTASQGGSAGYVDAGFTLGCHLADECPFDADIDEWSAELYRIATFIHDHAMLEQ